MFIWNGYTNGGQRAQNGDHDVVVTGTMASGQSTTVTVKVVVNFQGK